MTSSRVDATINPVTATVPSAPDSPSQSEAAKPPPAPSPVTDVPMRPQGPDTPANEGQSQPTAHPSTGDLPGQNRGPTNTPVASGQNAQGGPGVGGPRPTGHGEAGGGAAGHGANGAGGMGGGAGGGMGGEPGGTGAGSSGGHGGAGGGLSWGGDGASPWGSGAATNTFNPATGAYNSSNAVNAVPGRPDGVRPDGVNNPLPRPGATPNPLPPNGTTPNALPPAGNPAGQLPQAGLPNAVAGQAGAPPGMNQLVAPATALAGTSVTIGPRGTVSQPMFSPAAASAPSATTTAYSAQTAAGLPLRSTPQAAPVAAALGMADPRAKAAVAAMPPATAQPQQQPSGAQPTTAARAGQLPAPAAAANTQVAAQTAAHIAAQTAAAARGAAGSSQAVAQAQAALALALGRVGAGQMTAGGAAIALAEAQLALRVSRMAQLQLLAPAGAQGQRGVAAGPGAAASGARALAQAPAAGAQTAAQAPRAGAMPQSAAKGEAPTGSQVAAGAVMPKQLAITLAMAPKLRKRGSHDRVEKIDQFTPRAPTPEMEDEDFWDALGDAGDDDEDRSGPADQPEADAAAREAAAEHYRALHLWLKANDQQALLRELALGRRVMVLAPPDQTHQRLIGHVLWPDAADTPKAGTVAPTAGTRGRAWPLAARWSAMLPADVGWRQWRLRQWVDAAGTWQVAASQPDRHTPRLVLAGAEPAGAAPAVGEYITVAEPRRLRRLMGQQWTMMALRVPVPLDGMGTQGAVAGCQ